MNPIRKKVLSSSGSKVSQSSNGIKILVKAKTGQKENKVTPPPLRLFEGGSTSPDAPREVYIVSTKERPIQGRANESITKQLAEHFNVSRSQVRLISGATSKQKLFEIK